MIKEMQESNCYTDPYNCTVDSVTMWDVLEHIEDHKALLQNVENYVFLSLPIFKDREHAEASKHFRPGEHCWYFTRAGLINHMMDHGFGMIAHNQLESSLGREDIESFVFKRVQ